MKRSTKRHLRDGGLYAVLLVIVVLAIMAMLGNWTGVVRTRYIRSELRRR